MLYGFLILIGFQLAGEFISNFFRFGIPGPVIGMALLFLTLIICKGVPDGLEKAGGGLLKYIGLLFVPAGAGISMFLSLIAEHWDVILIASVTSTILTLISCAIIFKFLHKNTNDVS